MCSGCGGDVENPEMTSGETDPLHIALERAYEQMRVMCAWHPKYFGTELVMREGTSGRVSHGICDECRARVAA